MLANLKSEFRKLLSVRSTYYILLTALGLEILVFWFAKGYKIDSKSAQQVLSDPHFLNDQVMVAVSVLSMLYAIIVVLLVTHEYRYNIIMYTLSASKGRSRVLLAKLVVISVFAIIFGVVVAILAPLLTRLGLAMSHHTLVHQNFVLHSIVWRALFYSWGISMLAAIIAFLIRNQVGAFATVFLFPSTIENLLTLWLHDNSVYLPFSSLSVLANPTAPSNISFAHAALVALAWIVGGMVVAWALFVRRDAN